MNLRNRGIAVLSAFTTLLVVAAPALAADNIRIAGSDSFTDTHSCVDPLRVEITYDEMVHIFYDTNGNATQLLFTGAFSLQYTNLTNGATYHPNSSGPGLINLATGQAILRGSNAALTDSNGVLIAANGRAVYDANDHLVSLTGHVVDVCQRLGSTPL